MVAIETTARARNVTVMVSGTSLRGAGHVIAPSRKKLKLGQEHKGAQAWGSIVIRPNLSLAAHQTILAFLDV